MRRSSIGIAGVADPRIRLIWFGVLIAGAVVLPGAKGLGILNAYLVYHSWVCRRFPTGMRRLVPFLILVPALGLVFRGGEDWAASLAAVGARLMRITAMYLAAEAFVAGTSPEEGALVLAGFLFPFSPRLAKSAALHGLAAVGFFPLLGEEAKRLEKVQRFRGGCGRGLLERARKAQTLLVPLFESTLRRSAELVVGAELKGVGAKMAGYCIFPRPRQRDFFWLAGAIGLIMAGFVLG